MLNGHFMWDYALQFEWSESRKSWLPVQGATIQIWDWEKVSTQEHVQATA
jgi:hypothetical protein